MCALLTEVALRRNDSGKERETQGLSSFSIPRYHFNVANGKKKTFGKPRRPQTEQSKVNIVSSIILILVHRVPPTLFFYMKLKLCFVLLQDKHFTLVAQSDLVNKLLVQEREGRILSLRCSKVLESEFFFRFHKWAGSK